jgi:hypothetical protein
MMERRTVVFAGAVLAVLLTLSLAAGAQRRSDFPQQRPVAAETLETCRGPQFSDDESKGMAAVTEVAEVRQRFPGSYMFVPTGPGPHPGILAMHGSGGGRFTPGMSCTARFYASRGYATLSFCYFDCGDDALPEALADIDLRRTTDALAWLKRSPHVGGGKVVLVGASRGAEKAALLATLLARAARKDPSIVVPDALYASAPYGRVVGVFNWRNSPGDARWESMRELWADCVRDPKAAACARRPALEPSECWIDDPSGRYRGPNGRRRSWVTRRCAAEPSRAGQIFDRPAWTWDKDPDRARPGTEINLADYPGPILIAHGATDPVWSVEDGPEHLRRTLTRHAVASHWEVVPKFDKRISTWPQLPRDRVLFYIFEGEPHLFSTWGVVARRTLFLAFLERALGAS